MNKDYITFAEPHEELGDMVIVMPTRYAIIVQQFINAKRGRTMSDEQALDEFMIINWASFFGKEK
jgi:hypothetical protein